MQRRTFLQLTAAGFGALLVGAVDLVALADQPSPFDVYLTFDAGPSTKEALTGPTIDTLDILKEYKTPATFFPNGRNLSAWEGSVLSRMLLEGHALGNRLWQETGNAVGDQASTTLLAAQYLKAEKKLRGLIQATDQDAAQLYAGQAKLYRRPGGDTQLGAFLDPDNYVGLTREPYIKPYVDVIDWLKEVYDYSGWHVSTGSAKSRSAYALSRWITNGGPGEQGTSAFLCVKETQRRALETSAGLIIQLFDSDKLTPDALPQIILQLRSRGAHFKKLPRLPDKPNTFLLGVELPPTADPNGAPCNE